MMLAALGAVAGCAYYNGLYNANQLAGEARKAERQGRPGEAKALWAEAAVKAESVTSRYPKSKYRDDALLLMGTALVRSEGCTRAVDPFVLAVDSSPDRAIRRDARLQLGICYLDLGYPDSARITLTPLVDDSDATVRNAALVARGRAELALGGPDRALEDLTRSASPDAAFPAAVALLRLGEADSAERVLAARVPGPYDDSAWAAALDSLGEVDPAGAATIVSALTARDGLTDGMRARLALADGLRWLARDSLARAADRFTAADGFAHDSLDGGTARGYLAVTAVRRAVSADSIPRLLAGLNAAANNGGTRARILVTPSQDLLANVSRLLSRADSADPLRWFRTSELVRDSLRAPALAVDLFRRLAATHPASVLAPKALLAVAAARPDLADSIAGVLHARYPTSVYTLALSGEAGAAYHAVEDSLAKLLLSPDGGLSGAPEGTPADRKTGRRRPTDSLQVIR